jgi:hypothetical protein
VVGRGFSLSLNDSESARGERARERERGEKVIGNPYPDPTATNKTFYLAFRGYCGGLAPFRKHFKMANKERSPCMDMQTVQAVDGEYSFRMLPVAGDGKVISLGYDAENQVLNVNLTEIAPLLGVALLFRPVPKEVWDKFLAAEDKDAFYDGPLRDGIGPAVDGAYQWCRAKIID